MSSRTFIRAEKADPQLEAWQPPNFSEGEEPGERSQDARVYVFEPFYTPGEEEPEEEELVQRTLEEAKAEAEAILEAARKESERLKKEAAEIRARAEQEGREEGYRTGHEKGLAEGREQGRNHFEERAVPALAAFEQAETLYRDLWSVNQAALVKLAGTMAERIVFQELKTSPELIASAFQAAFDMLHEQHQADFRLHPDDLETLQEIRDEMRDRISGLVRVTLTPDSDLSRGDLVLDTESGRVDATLRRRIQNVIGAVDDVLSDAVDLDW